jgi:hypothetical protein
MTHRPGRSMLSREMTTLSHLAEPSTDVRSRALRRTRPSWGR